MLTEEMRILPWDPSSASIRPQSLCSQLQWGAVEGRLTSVGLPPQPRSTALMTQRKGEDV